MTISELNQPKRPKVLRQRVLKRRRGVVLARKAISLAPGQPKEAAPIHFPRIHLSEFRPISGGWSGALSSKVARASKHHRND